MWNEIECHEYLFNRDKERLKAMIKITKEKLIDYFDILFFKFPKQNEYQLIANQHIKENE